MAQKNIVQDGIIVYATSDPALSVDFSVRGQANVTKQLNVGDDPLADGLITSPAGTDLVIRTGAGGNLSLQQSTGGFILLNNMQWPDGTTTPNPGYFLGSSSANTLQFYAFILAFNPSDSLTQSALNAAYPTAQVGQMVVGPTVIYTNVSLNTWRTSGGGGGSPSVPDTQIAFGDVSNQLSSSSDFTYNVGTGQLTVGPTAANTTISAQAGRALTVSANNGITLATTGSTVQLDTTGALVINGSAGTAGQVVSSAGPGAPIVWASAGGGGSVTPLLVNLVKDDTIRFGGASLTGWALDQAVITSDHVHWDTGTRQLLFDIAGYYKVTVTGELTSSGSTWPDSFVIFGSQLYGFNSVGLNQSSRHTTMTGVNPNNWAGAQSWGQTPEPQIAKISGDVYYISVNASTYQSVAVFAYNYDSIGIQYNATMTVLVEWLGPL